MISKENILKLYNGEYGLELLPPPKTETYNNAIEKCAELERLLCSKLDKSDRHIIDDLLNYFSQIYSEESRQIYIEGFSFSIKLFIEAMYGA